jgi:hypothetical protein
MRTLIPVILGVAFLAFPGAALADDIIVLTGLSGDQETPPVDTSASGFAFYVISDAQDMISYFVEFSGLSSNATGAHIHVGDFGVAGPIILPYHNVPSDTGGLLIGQLTAADLTPAGGIETFQDAINAILDGGTYTNVHSQMHPGGEIRGQNEVFQ